MSYTNTDTITITNGYNNSINYTGNLNNNVFTNSININSFTNSGIILGGGGIGGNTSTYTGKNGLLNNISCTITTLINTGSFLGGGGGGDNSNNNGGSGGGGGARNNIGGSLYSGSPIINGGGGPGQNGADGNGTGGSFYGPFGGGGSSDNGSNSNGFPATINGGGAGGPGNAGGGGGYGGGAGGSNCGGGGGGGSGGPANGGMGGGPGGYSIYNYGTITTLINLQGGLISDTDPNNYPYGPLFYAGVAPNNYNIIINSTTRYGQLWCTGVTDTTGSITFNIADGSILTTGTYSSVLKFNTGTVTLNNTSGTYQNSSWTLVPNGLYYDLVIIYSAPCFKIGSKILTDKGYQLIENLRNGDLVKTLKNGYLRIVMIGKSEIYNSGNEDRIKNRLYNLSCKKYNDINEDLVLTGCHSILVDTLTSFQALEMGGEEKRLYITDDKLRLFCYLDPSSDPYDKEGTFTIYHIALENENYYGNYGIYANGLLVETCSIRYLKELSNMILIE